MATNLNIEIRGQIKDCILKKTFAAKVEELTSKRVALADAIYFATVPPAFIKLASQPEVPAKGWFVTAEYVKQHCIAGGFKIAGINGPSGREDNARMSQRRPVPSDLYHQWSHALVLDATPETKAMVDGFNAEVEQYLAAREEADVKLHALLCSVRTIEKLAEVAPELAEFIPEQLKAPKPKLPAIQAGDVIATLIHSGLQLKA